MKYDTVVIGGGLSGLTCAIALAQAGQKVALVAAGQSSLYFAGASLGLLGYDAQGAPVTSPLKAVKNLPAGHPYKKVGDVAALALEAQQLLADAGIKTTGNADANHATITPIGALKPAWLSLDGYLCLEDNKLPYNKVALMNIIGYLDFPTKFLAHGLRELGVEVDVKAITLPELNEARKSPSEMRATNIAKVLYTPEIVARLAAEINAKAGDAQAVLLPAVLGIKDDSLEQSLVKLVDKPVHYIATIPPSVPGARLQTLLRRRFEALGGTFFNGDKVVRGSFANGTLKAVETEKLVGSKLEATNFVLATGSFMGRGLVSDYVKVYEPVLGLDVDYLSDRAQWTRDNVFDAQPYMEFGVKTDDSLHVLKDGNTIDNVYAVGQVLAGNNKVKLASGEGVDMLTALAVAKNILN